MTIYLLVNTQFKSVNENAVEEPVKMTDCTIKIARSFNLEGVHSGELNYSQLHALGRKFAQEFLKHAQFALYAELGKMNALPLSIYESLIFNPGNIKLDIDDKSVSLTPLIHYYRLLNLPRIHLIDQFVDFAKQKGEMSFTTSAMRFCLSEPPCFDLLNTYKHIAAKPVDLSHQHLIDTHAKCETALQEMFKSVLYDLTMNDNNRNSYEYEQFRNLLHDNDFNSALLNKDKPSQELIADVLDQPEYTELDYDYALKTLNNQEYDLYKDHYCDNLQWFKETMAHIKAAVDSCCHVFTIQ